MRPLSLSRRVRATGLLDAAGSRLLLTTRRDVEAIVSVEISAFESKFPGHVEVIGELVYEWGRGPRLEVERVRAVELPSVAEWSTLVETGDQEWDPEEARAALEAFHQLDSADTSMSTGGHVDRFGRTALHIDVISISPEIARWADALPAGMVDLRAAVVPA